MSILTTHECGERAEDMFCFNWTLAKLELRYSGLLTKECVIKNSFLISQLKHML